jgi:hypothetical protein
MGLANDFAKIRLGEAKVEIDGAVAQPNLGFTVFLDDMNMRRFVVVGRLEEKAMSLPLQKRRHWLTRSIPRPASGCRAA